MTDPVAATSQSEEPCPCWKTRTTIAAGMFYFIAPNQIGWMVALTLIVAITYGPTIPVLWAMLTLE